MSFWSNLGSIIAEAQALGDEVAKIKDEAVSAINDISTEAGEIVGDVRKKSESLTSGIQQSATSAVDEIKAAFGEPSAKN